MEIFYTSDEPAMVTLYGTQSELCGFIIKFES